MAGVADVFKALSNPNRLKVYQAVCSQNGNGRGLTIEQICKAVRMKQPAVSTHVARLAAAGLVLRTKSRWWVHCTASRHARALIARFARHPDAVEP